MTSFRYVPPTEESFADAPSRTSGYKSGALIAAFQILDTNRQGFFPKDILLHLLTSKGDRGLDPDFVEGVLDEVAIGGRVYYRDLCELFRETSFKAENKSREITDSKIQQKSEAIQEEILNEPVETAEIEASPMDVKRKMTQGDSFGDSDDSYPKFDQGLDPTPTERRGSASTEQLETHSAPFTAQKNESLNGQASSLHNFASTEHLEEVPPKLGKYVTGNGEAAMQSAEEIPELLKQAESSQN